MTNQTKRILLNIFGIFILGSGAALFGASIVFKGYIPEKTSLFFAGIIMMIAGEVMLLASISLVDEKECMLPAAVDCVAKHLRCDDDYFKGWQANIALNCFDAIIVDDLFDKFYSNEEYSALRAAIHDGCNEGAKNFLNQLSKENKYVPKQQMTSREMIRCAEKIRAIDNSDLGIAYTVLLDYCEGTGFEGAGCIKFEDLPKPLQKIISEVKEEI